MHPKLTRVRNYCSILCLLVLFGISLSVQAQFTDDFEDGDFTNNPEWTGDNALFTVVAYELDETNLMLRSNNNEAATYYLSTPSFIVSETSWEFFINLRYQVSGANIVDAYLVADNDDLTAVQNGYFLRFGRTQRDISFWKRQGGSEVMLLEGPDNQINSSSSNPFQIRVTRNQDGLWGILVDQGATGNFQSLGFLNDDEFDSTVAFGFRIVQSGAQGPINSHWFDDIEVAPIPPDETPPQVVSVVTNSPTEAVLTFDEPLDQSSAENVLNYLVSDGIGNPVSAIFDTGSLTSVTLEFGTPLNDGQVYTLTVSNVEDLAGNAMDSQELDLLFFTTQQADFRDIVFNELMIDETPPVGLPVAEFIELYNSTPDKFIDLTGWTYVNGTTERTLGEFVLFPESYVILCRESDAALFESYGDLLTLSSWPALTNSADSLTLLNDEGNLVDVVSYTIDWYQDPDKNSGGWTLEQINPFTECSGQQNWRASDDPSGGTPGAENSIFDTTPDTDPPVLTGFNINNAQSISLFFNEALDPESLNDAQFDIVPAIGIAETAMSGNFLSINLQLAAPIDTGVTYTITVTGITDCPGNPIADQNSIEFLIGYQPGLYDVLINEIMADPTPAVGLPPHEYIELYNPTDRLFDLSDCRISTATFRPNTFIAPGEHLVLISPTNEGQFPGIEPLAVMQSMSTTFLTNAGRELYFANENDELIDRVEYSIDWYQDNVKANGGWSLERINPEEPCRAGSNWIASENPNGGTPGQQNSVYDNTPDSSPPVLVDFAILGPQNITLFFNETLDTTTVDVENISISPEIEITSLSVSEDALAINLLLQQPIDTGIYYTATITEVTDCVGNMIGEENSILFIIGYDPGLYDVLINEIMADPTPPVGLPPHEYIELYNPTDRIYDLSNCAISSSVTFRPNTFIEPGQYLVLISPSVEGEFPGIDNVVVMQSMSTTFLTNAGRELLFTNANNEKIDRVNYSIDWYRDQSKNGGGWSLERINPEEPCRAGDNWRASDHFSGGTPGAENSVLDLSPDETGPRIETILVPDEFTIELVFNEVLDETSVNEAIYEFTPELNLSDAEIVAPDMQRIRITFADALAPNAKHEVFIIGLTDCVGNDFENSEDAYFGLPGDATTGSVIINEILFNARTGGANFLEVYNNSDAIVSIEDWEIANLGNDQYRLISHEAFILFPEEYLAITTNKANIIEEYPFAVEKRVFQTAQMPSFNNSEGKVILINADGETVDRFDYDADMHFPLLRDVKGVSLERIDFNRPSDDRTNWMSAAENVNWATPGFENSQFMQSVEEDGEVWVDPEVFSPDNDGYQDVLNINYRFDRSGLVGNIKIFDSSGRLVRRLMQNELLSTEGVISWDGTGDNMERARVGIHVVFMEVFSADGYTKGYKLSCVVASRY